MKLLAKKCYAIITNLEGIVLSERIFNQVQYLLDIMGMNECVMQLFEQT